MRPFSRAADISRALQFWEVGWSIANWSPLRTALLVIVAVGVATLSFGFKLTGSSTSAGVVTTALAFGFVLLALAYTLGPISGCHVNPAVTLGFLVSGRMSIVEAAGYWVAQFVGGIIGALTLWATFSSAPTYSRSGVGLGADRWGHKTSMVGIGAGGAFTTEAVLTSSSSSWCWWLPAGSVRQASPAWPSAWRWPWCTSSASR